MGIFKKKEWILKADKRRLRAERKRAFYEYLYLSLFVLIPVFFIWYAYFKFDWFAEFIGSRYVEARGKITFGLLGIIVFAWLFIYLFKKIFYKNKK